MLASTGRGHMLKEKVSRERIDTTIILKNVSIFTVCEYFGDFFDTARMVTVVLN